MVNFGLLTAEIGWRVWGTSANFNALASLLHRHQSTEINRTLHDVWPSPGLVYYIYIFGGSCPLTEFCQVQNSLCVPKSCVLLYWRRYCTAFEEWASAKLCGVHQKAPPVISRAAITLGIGPRSSCARFSCFSISKPKAWLGRTSPKWPILYPVGRKKVNQSNKNLSLTNYYHYLLSRIPTAVKSIKLEI